MIRNGKAGLWTKEKTAPAGYKLDEKEYTVKLGAAGSTINSDEPVPAVFNVINVTKW